MAKVSVVAIVAMVDMKKQNMQSWCERRPHHEILATLYILRTAWNAGKPVLHKGA